MTPTDTSEKGFETLIVDSLLNEAGYERGRNEDYVREFGVDWSRLFHFLSATQPKAVETLGIEQDGPKRHQFLSRLQGEIMKRGIVDVLRKGIKHGPCDVELFYGTASPGNVRAAELYAQNIFSVTRQLHYSRNETALSLDLAVFINGLPIATFELKNKLTKQNADDAERQYKRDRDPRELIFQFGRCMVHFALDDHEVRMCTHLQGAASWFLPFNRGYNDGAGNPPNPGGLATDYLWKRILSKNSLTDIIENYAQIVDKKQIFPRFHQLEVVRKLLADAAQTGAGRRYLIQHSAGSGKSNSIAWLAYQLIGLKKDDKDVFDSVIVVTDRRVLDKQIKDTIRGFAQVSSTVGHAENSGDLRNFISAGKKIIITTVQKFPFILAEIGKEHRTNRFAIIIDEAHSSQGGKATSAMNTALGAGADTDDEGESTEDRINALLEELMKNRKMLGNASYFAFTATPKNKTLEIFGEPYPQPDGTVKHRPFHSYTMKQAIQERFILDVLQSYTPVNSYFRLAKTVEDDPLFDKKKAPKKLRKYVESDDHSIVEKAEIMVDHFHTHVVQRGRIGGQARAMVITNGIAQAIRYYHAFKKYLQQRRSPYQAIIAFSGEHEFNGQKVTEATLNGFPSSQIVEKIQKDPYRFLIVADKFQTGYDEPLLHTMYVDKTLSGIKAVQTLSRLNRAHPQKSDTFVLDFHNEADVIQASFEPFYRTTILSEETDPNKLHDLKAALDGADVYSPEQITQFVERYLGGASRDDLDPILDRCVAAYGENLDENGQITFKGGAKSFVRTYGFLASVLPYTNVEWEKLSVFLNFLIPKLPAPVEEDLSRGILEAIDLDSYRAEVQATISIALADQDAEIAPIPMGAGGGSGDPELERLSNLIQAFNDQFGNIDWKDVDKIRKVIAEEIPAKVGADAAYQNAMANSDMQNARIEHDRVLLQVMVDLLSDHTELYKQFIDNPSFRKWLSDTNFNATYQAK